MQAQTINFTKMHGLGNDFIVIDAIHQKINITDLTIPTLSHRYTGIGFDQLLWLSSSTKADFSCRFFNADGSEAEQCGNGVRCIARYIHENKLLNKNKFWIETKASLVEVLIKDYAEIEVKLGIPIIEENIQLSLQNNMIYPLSILSLGNPHAILLVETLENFPITTIGSQIATHQSFAHGINVGFVQIKNSHHIILRTYERGVGETLACGSNACAAVVSGILNQQLAPDVTVELPLGTLQIQWAGPGMPVIMTGPAEKVFDGVLDCFAITRNDELL